MFISPSTIQSLIGEQLINWAIGGDTMDRFLHYIVNAMLEKNSSSSPPSAKMQKKMEQLW